MKLFKKWHMQCRYRLNDRYNERWVRQHNIKRAENLNVVDMINVSPNKEHAVLFMTVWLKNIDRLLKTIRHETSEYAFLDVGCGRGISTLYVATKYNFSKVEGFDFEDTLIEDAILNSKALPECPVRFFNADAGTYELPHRKQIVYMFNPFAESVMDDFMRNNIETLRATNSKIAYANYHQIKTIMKYGPQDIRDIKSYRCALISF